MTWEDIKNRKEDSIRESTENPMIKNPNDKNDKTYESITDYLNSEEYIELLKLEEEATEEYKKRAKEYFESLRVDNQLFLFFHITNCIYENYFNDNGSYRGLLYDKFGFGPDSYSIGLDSGMFAVHNSISTPKENEERFQAFMKFFKLELSKEDMISARNYFEYGFDNSEKISSMASGQQVIDFNKDPK